MFEAVDVGGRGGGAEDGLISSGCVAQRTKEEEICGKNIQHITLVIGRDEISGIEPMDLLRTPTEHGSDDHIIIDRRERFREQLMDKQLPFILHGPGEQLRWIAGERSLLQQIERLIRDVSSRLDERREGKEVDEEVLCIELDGIVLGI